MRRWRHSRREMLGLGAGLAAAGLPWSGIARASAAGAASLADYIAVIELHGRYSFAADLTPQPEDYADIFTEDGAFLGLQGRGGTSEGIRGRAALLAFSERAKSTPGRNVDWVIHHNQSSNVVFALDGTRAVTRTYLLATRTGKTQAPILGVGSEYEDQMVRTEQGWRIFERRAGSLGNVDPALFAAPFPRLTLSEEAPMPASALDTLEIVDLVARWSHAADGDRRDALDRVMTPDAVLEISGETPARAEGLDAVWALLGGGDGRTREVRRHVRNTVVLDTDGGRATARSYYMITVGDRPPALALIATGLYTDELVRTGAGWRIARRVATPDGAVTEPGPRG